MSCWQDQPTFRSDQETEASVGVGGAVFGAQRETQNQMGTDLELPSMGVIQVKTWVPVPSF